MSMNKILGESPRKTPIMQVQVLPVSFIGDSNLQGAGFVC
jgi:hypothetical protein